MWFWFVVRRQEKDNYWIWTSSCLVLVAIAVAAVQFISKEAEGSGIPQLRAIMSGVYQKNMLSWWTYLAKFLGLTCMLCSGLSLGKMAPFVHLAACLAANLPYRMMKQNKTLRHQIFTAAIAVGVTATFGAPIGGVLFSIELTANTYNLYNLWKSLYSATIAVIIFKACKLLGMVALFDASAHNFYRGSYPIGLNQELPFFMIIAVIMGIVDTFPE